MKIRQIIGVKCKTNSANKDRVNNVLKFKTSLEQSILEKLFVSDIEWTTAVSCAFNLAVFDGAHKAIL